MSRDGSITLVWGDGERRFRLRIGELRELQEKTGNSGPSEIALRLSNGRWRIDDIRETLRLGLIGGGTAPADAYMLISRYVDPPERPWAENIPPAQAVILASIIGVPEEPLGKDQPAGENATTTTTEGSNSPTSTAPGPPWDSIPAKSTNGASGNSSR